MAKRQFQMTAKLAAVVGEFDLISEAGRDLFNIPGGFQHPLHGRFNIAFVGDPPKLVIMHANTRRVGLVEVQPMLEALAKEMVKARSN